MNKLTEGTFLRWIDQSPDDKPLGIVISPPGGETGDSIYVLMADSQANTDLEVFVAGEAATGRDASTLVQESMEVVEAGDPELMGFLRTAGPNWWHISAHLDGGHADRGDPGCLLCREADQTA
jgi:hypothetical protein